MKISQRDVIEVVYQTGANKFETHPAVVISNDEITTAEGFFYAVMLSHTADPEEFTFEITDQMRTQPAQDNRHSYAKCQMIEQFEESEVKNKFGSIRPDAFKQLKARIIEVLF